MNISLPLRILIVSSSLPIPTSGGRTRLYNLIKQLADRHHISLLSFIQPHEYDLLPLVESVCTQMELVPIEYSHPTGKWRNRLNGWANLLIKSLPSYLQTYPIGDLTSPLCKMISSHGFDVVVLNQLFIAPLKYELVDFPTVLAEDNVESKIARRSYDLSENRIHQLRNWLIWRKLLAFERRWVQRFRVCVAVSEIDGNALRVMSPATEVFVVPNGVDITYFAPPRSIRSSNRLLFFGTLSYGPNAEGLLWFCGNVFPKIREELPEVELDITGLDPPPRIRQLEDQPGVNLLGFVPDIREPLWSSGATVVPILVGGGTRLKILEALAAECPIVSTKIGAEGLGVVDRDHLLIADSADQFASAVISLLQSPELGRTMAERGRQFVSERYDWRKIAPKLENACLRAIALAS